MVLGVEAATAHKNESPEAVAALLSKNFANTIVQLANDVINVVSDIVPDGSAAGVGLDIFSDELQGGFGDSLVSIISSVLEMPKRFQDKPVANKQGPFNYVQSMIADIDGHTQGDYRLENLRMV